MGNPMIDIKESYDAYKNGYKLDDDELTRFTGHMELTTQQLDDLGPAFKIVADHCREIARRNRGYMFARRLKHLTYSSKFSLNELISHGVFEHDGGEDDCGVVDPKLTIRDSHDNKMESYAIRSRDGNFYVQCTGGDAQVDPDEKDFVLFKNGAG
jgi:hypothetical protein